MEITTENQEQYQQKVDGIDGTSFGDSSGECDLTLKIEDKKIFVCKAVLCIASPVFKAMLKTEFREKGQAEIELPGKKYEDFVEFLCCIYPDELKLITETNAYRVLPLVSEYQVRILEQRIHKLLIQLVNGKHKLSNTEIYRHLQLAELYNLDELKDQCIALASDLTLAKMDDGSSQFCVSDKSVLQIRYMALQKREKLLQANELDRGDDMHLFKTANKWVMMNGENVKYSALIKQKVEITVKTCPEILRAIRLCVRYFNNEPDLLERHICTLNAKTDVELQAVERELELLPEHVKMSLRKYNAK
ncbi:BTB and MATH domain-containing protein 38-like [Ruditapes philippinarum]|uniref:BTB and MATH domain-containing protein 38-like n=1 Tax=Ruditapes philippinarum TaxID=129788 RepID=UPI00295A61BD|nr:BTB and MATH domain-containing protein 38-like [Ruditapes philippinarum]